MAQQKLENLAKQILKKIKAEVISSNDILSFQELPFLMAGQFDKYRMQFGSKKLNEYIACEEKLNRARGLLEASSPLLQEIPCPETVALVTPTFCGVGACGETSYRATMELIVAGCTAPIRIVLVSGKRRDKDVFYNHMFLIIGNAPANWPRSNDLNAFTSLNADCVLLDPLLGIVGKAQQTQMLLKDYFSTYEMDRFQFELHLPEELIEGAKLVLKNSKQIAARINKKAGFVGAESMQGAAAAFFSTSVVEPAHQLLLEKLNSLITSSQRAHYSSLLQAIESRDYALAYRRACAQALHPSVVFAVLAHAEGLNINLQAPSSNGKTGLDWLHENSHFKKNIDLILLAIAEISPNAVNRPSPFI